MSTIIVQTEWIGPHTDDAIIGDVTVGVILAGTHELYIGDGMYVGDLVPGSVYVLQNKKMHGARQKCSERADDVLVIAAVDLVVLRYSDVVKHLTHQIGATARRLARGADEGY